MARSASSSSFSVYCSVAAFFSLSRLFLVPYISFSSPRPVVHASTRPSPVSAPHHRPHPALAARIALSLVPRLHPRSPLPRPPSPDRAGRALAPGHHPSPRLTRALRVLGLASQCAPPKTPAAALPPGRPAVPTHRDQPPPTLPCQRPYLPRGHQFLKLPQLL